MLTTSTKDESLLSSVEDLLHEVFRRPDDRVRKASVTRPPSESADSRLWNSGKRANKQILQFRLLDSPPFVAVFSPF
jgi:hypothetical protein